MQWSTSEVFTAVSSSPVVFIIANRSTSGSEHAIQSAPARSVLYEPREDEDTVTEAQPEVAEKRYP
jgi:hypothetical protein